MSKGNKEQFTSLFYPFLRNDKNKGCNWSELLPCYAKLPTALMSVTILLNHYIYC